MQKNSQKIPESEKIRQSGEEPMRLKMTTISNLNPNYTSHMWFLRLENFKEHYIEWDKRLKTMIKKDWENKKEKEFRDIPYAQFMDELHNKMYGSLIASIYTDVEFDLSTILNSSSNISKVKELKDKYLEKYQIDITQIGKYEEIELLRKCTNDFKHNAGVPRDVNTPCCTSWGNIKEIDYRKIDILDILKHCKMFFDDLKEQVNMKLNSSKEVAHAE